MTKIFLFIFSSFLLSNSPVNNFVIGFWPEYDHPGVLVSIQIEVDSSELPLDFKIDVPNNAKMVIETIIDGENRDNNMLTVEYDEFSENSFIASKITNQRYLLQFYYNPFDNSNSIREISYKLKTSFDLSGFYVVIQKHLGADEYQINLKDLETIEDNFGITYYRKKIDFLNSVDSMLFKINYLNPNSLTTMDLLNMRQESMTEQQTVQKNETKPLKNNYLDNKIYTLLVLLSTTVIVYTLYLFYSRDDSSLNKHIACNKCKKIINEKDLFCSFCGGKNVS
tara:strand:- start:1 stop:843 length:843 start_codon:yes stop_codon:yes gene_type:complete